jgi:hypothetical protein
MVPALTAGMPQAREIMAYRANVPPAGTAGTQHSLYENCWSMFSIHISNMRVSTSLYQHTQHTAHTVPSGIFKMHLQLHGAPGVLYRSLQAQPAQCLPHVIMTAAVSSRVMIMI